jgi:bifunctional non-homologous end joining protein LigD
MPKNGQLQIGKLKVDVSNLDKVLYPKTGFTKGQVIEYYIQVSSVLLPHLKDRPITLKRYPEGVEGFFFYERKCPSHRPAWVRTAAAARTEGGEVDYCVMGDLAALVWAANLADLELHTFLHRTPKIECPTMVAFDLDPGAPADLVTCCEVDLLLKKLLEKCDLKGFPKTSGSKGLQICVPLNSPAAYEQTKAFAHAVAEHLQRAQPSLVVSKMQKSLREGKVLVDWSQNDRHKTTICVYSLRAREHPTVSTPVTWSEVEKTAKAGDPAALTFESQEVLHRVKKLGDLFAPVLTLKQKLPDALKV